MAEGVNVNWEKQTTNKFSYFYELNNQPWFQIKNKTNINSSQKPFFPYLEKQEKSPQRSLGSGGIASDGDFLSSSEFIIYSTSCWMPNGFPY